MPKKRRKHAAWTELVDEPVLKRGREYAADGAVYGLIDRGDRLEAWVMGSASAPYRVTIQLTDGEVVGANCTCPYDWGGLCKHIVAVLTVWGDDPTVAEQAPSLGDLVAGLDAEALRTIVFRAADAFPDVVEWLTTAMRNAPTSIATPTPDASTANPTRRRSRTTSPATLPSASVPATSAIDIKALRRRIEGSLRGVVPAAWAGSDAPERLQPYIDTARAYLDQGDGTTALAIGEAVAAPLAERYEDYEGECEVSMFLEGDVAELMAEAVFVARPSGAQRRALAERWAGWDTTLNRNYGFTPFTHPRQALDIAADM